MTSSYALSWKPCQRDSLNLPDHRIHKDGDGDALFQLKSDSLPHAHAQTTKTYYKHQDSRIMKAQELKTKTSAQTLIYKIFLQRYQVYQGRLLASFQDDAKYEHVGQDTRSLESCMALADLGASINLMLLSVWKKLSLPKLTPTRMTLELATQTVAYLAVDYDVDPRVPIILGRPFLRTAHALVDVHGEELTLRVSDEKLVFNIESTLKYP
ncbi:reverse transcriptase domain-containing protein [Tanacetum coccineum]